MTHHINTQPKKPYPYGSIFRIHGASYLLEKIFDLNQQRIDRVNRSELYDKALSCIGLTIETLRSNNRKRLIADSRQMFYYIMRIHYRRRLNEIGKFVIRDHSSVVNGVKTMTNKLKYEEPLRKRMENIIECLSN